MLRHLAGARTVLERGMIEGLKGEGVLAKQDLAQPTGWGPGAEEGTLASGSPYAG